MDDGIIELDSDRGRELGFTSDRFDGYLWKAGQYVVVSFIASKAKGNFKELCQSILVNGLGVKVPTPLGAMQGIVRRAGYKMTWEDDEIMGPVEIWTMEPTT